MFLPPATPATAEASASGNHAARRARCATLLPASGHQLPGSEVESQDAASHPEKKGDAGSHRDPPAPSGSPRGLRARPAGGARGSAGTNARRRRGDGTSESAHSVGSTPPRAEGGPRGGAGLRGGGRACEAVLRAGIGGSQRQEWSRAGAGSLAGEEPDPRPYGGIGAGERTGNAASE